MTPLQGRRRRCALALAAALPLPASAGFFIPRDVTMFMFSASPDSQMADIAYGVRADLALSAGQSRYRSDDGRLDRRYSTLQANWLIHRDYGADGYAPVRNDRDERFDVDHVRTYAFSVDEERLRAAALSAEGEADQTGGAEAPAGPPEVLATFTGTDWDTTGTVPAAIPRAEPERQLPARRARKRSSAGDVR